MRMRTAVAAVTLAGCALLAAGCKNATTTGSAPAPATSAGSAPASSADAKSALLAAIKADQKTSYKFQVAASGGAAAVHSDGAFDPASRTMTVNASAGGQNFQMIMLGTDMYMQFPAGVPGMGQLSGKWMHLDTSKMSSLRSLGLQDPSDPVGVDRYQQMITDVHRTGPGQYAGTLDLSKAPQPAASALPGAPSLGPVPFRATVDDQGRLTSLTSTVTIEGRATTTKTTLSDFGTPVSANRPSGSSVVEAPSSIYRVLGA